jgi:hypothetical protein
MEVPRMLKSTKTRNSIAVLFISLILSATLSAQNPPDNQLLKMVPADSLFCVRINNFDFSLNQLDQFLAGASPMPMNISMLVRMQLAGLLGGPQLNGLDTNGCFSIFGVILPGESAENNPISNLFIGILAPVTDYKQLIEGNANCFPSDDKGISNIVKNGKTSILVTQADNYALLCSPKDYEKIIKIKQSILSSDSKGLVSTIDSTEAKLSANEPIWIFGNIQLASKAFGPMLLGKIEEMKNIMKNLPANQPGMQVSNIQNIINMYASILDIFMKETKSLSVTINPKPDVLNITKTISAIPGAEIANIFVTDSTSEKQNKLLPYLENGAMANFAIKSSMTSFKSISDKSVDLLSKMVGESMTAEKIKNMKDFSSNMADCLGESMAISVSINNNIKPPFVAKYFIEIKDEEKFNQLTDEAMEMMNTSGIMDFYKGLGMDTSFKITRNVDNYKGVTIDAAKFSMKSTDVNSPQGQMINNIYGDGFDYQWGIVNGLFVCAVGGDVNTEVHKLIDKIKANTPKQNCEEIQSAMALLPQANKANFFMTYNILRLFTMMSSMSPMPIPKMDVQSQSNIVIAGKTGDGKLVVEIAIPKQHITEIMSTFMMMQQKTMQPNQPNMMQETP